LTLDFWGSSAGRAFTPGTTKTTAPHAVSPKRHGLTKLPPFHSSTLPVFQSSAFSWDIIPVDAARIIYNIVRINWQYNPWVTLKTMETGWCADGRKDT
jgi:hypothetical protein